MKRHIMLLAACLFAAAGCDDHSAILGPTNSTQSSTRSTRSMNPAALTAMSFNVYYGVDLDILADESMMLPLRTAMVLAQLQATDAPARARAVARIIAASGPDLVGLQEVSKWRMQSPGDFLAPDFSIQNPVPNAETVIVDFLQLLLDALAEQGVHYNVASQTITLDAELPVLNGMSCSPCSDLRLTESVVVLARAGVPFRNPQNHLFEVNLPISIAGMQVQITKGFAAVDATVGGRTYRFVTTHLEPADVGPDHALVEPIHQIQRAQAAQLLGWLDDSPHPVVLTGDLNSEPDGTSTDAYEMVIGSGFVDTWLVGPSRGDGFTANQDADLRNPVSALWHRIDYVLYRDEFTARGGPFRGSVDAYVVGDRPSDRTPGGLWPSDHAGVVATLRLGAQLAQDAWPDR
jgi:endonuclease/exonuclease/phosphatase family metal-dependent hydrolase